MWQICRVEGLLVNGIIKGSIIHIHRARTIIIDTDGLITASELGRESNSVIVFLFLAALFREYPQHPVVCF
jgi:hypothetical protein